jgi:uncharacterized protein (DUF1501 family)
MSAPCNRRTFLKHSAAAGLGLYPALARAAAMNGGGALAPRAGQRAGKAKRLLFVFLTGGFSHVDTFDFKPRLQADHGKPVPTFGLRPNESQPLKLLASPFAFAPRGRSGLMISELFPRLGAVADELCVVRSLHTDIVEHFQATLAMHTGSATVPMPSIGSWLSYGLGTFNPNLPPYVVLAEHTPYAGAQVWDSNFLPPEHGGVRIVPGDEPVADLKPPAGRVPPAQAATLQELEQLMLRDVNERHADRRAGIEAATVNDLRARADSFAVARGMMREAPEALDVAREPEATREWYGVAAGDDRSFAWQCLAARRLLERGVRVVELIDTGSSDNWDAHGDMRDHRPKAQRVDRALAALVGDLRRTGLLDDTLVAICTEFGRTPWTDNRTGRNHYAKAFTCLLAGAGVRGGVTVGETDEYGMNIVSNPVHVHDYHATILHLMGLDHERLTYRYAGRDFRLTDVAGRVVGEMLA